MKTMESLNDRHNVLIKSPESLSQLIVFPGSDRQQMKSGASMRSSISNYHSKLNLNASAASNMARVQSQK